MSTIGRASPVRSRMSSGSARRRSARMDRQRPCDLVPQLVFLVAQPLAMGLGALAQQGREDLGAAARYAFFGAAPATARDSMKERSAIRRPMPPSL